MGRVSEASMDRGSLRRLLQVLRRFSGAVVAFSGGVDSSVLLAAAKRVYGERVVAVTGLSPVVGAEDRRFAEAVVAQLGVRHRFIQTRELDDPRFVANGPDRCYVCKRHLFSLLEDVAAQEGLPVVLEGSNADDRDDFRPGRRAARELGVVSPLLEAGLDKRQVRELARYFGLPNAARPASACLASRIPYGTPIDRERLRRIEAAEEGLKALGFSLVRVRDHGAVARIEVAEEDVERLADKSVRERVVRRLTGLGWTHVTMDLRGYRTGSLNEELREEVHGGTKGLAGSKAEPQS